MSSDGGSVGHLGVHVGADWRVTCSTYPARTPILDIDAGPVCVALSIRADGADERAVQFARALVDEGCNLRPPLGSLPWHARKR